MSKKKKPPSIDLMLQDKMKVLRELCIVNDTNKTEVRRYLMSEIAANPYKNPRFAMDRAARRLIMGTITI